ncbi:hypothetical protein [Kitasatospora sp. McL0602]|uniref:hypothetical protein n=1 Tax=Kitasatospora sp. McL0602 TaxID=3439530 RepID=UPI003F8B125C
MLGAALVAVGTLGAGSASADGPKNQQEAAVCSQLLGWVGLTPTTLGAVCTVQGTKG